jgi:hypothetical protein
VKRNRPFILHSNLIADAWQAIGWAAADFEARKRAVAVDQMAAVISNYSERASSTQREAYLTHDDVGYLAATDARLHFWSARSMEVDVPLAVFGDHGGEFFEPKQLGAARQEEEEEEQQAPALVERLAAS